MAVDLKIKNAHMFKVIHPYTLLINSTIQLLSKYSNHN